MTTARMGEYAKKTPAQKAKAIATVRARQDRLKAEGRCTRCGKPSSPRCTGACEKHRVARNRLTNLYRLRRRHRDEAYRRSIRAILYARWKRRQMRLVLASRYDERVPSRPTSVCGLCGNAGHRRPRCPVPFDRLLAGEA